MEEEQKTLGEQENNQFFNNDSAQPAKTNSEPITWTASEFIAHEKSASWYIVLMLLAAVTAAILYLITKDKVTVAVVVVAALFFGIYAARKPRQLQYQLGVAALSIGDKRYQLSQFRSFSVVPEGAFSSVIFMPLKRFSAPTTIYYAPKDEDKIVSILAASLPMEEKGMDAVDRLMRKVRF